MCMKYWRISLGVCFVCCVRVAWRRAKPICVVYISYYYLFYEGGGGRKAVATRSTKTTHNKKQQQQQNRIASTTRSMAEPATQQLDWYRGVSITIYTSSQRIYILLYFGAVCVCVRSYVCYQGVCVCAIPKHYIHQARVRCRRIEAQNQYITPTNLNLKIKLPSACQDNVFV